MAFVVFFILTSVLMYAVMRREGEYVLVPTVWLFGLGEVALLYATALMAVSTLL